MREILINENLPHYVLGSAMISHRKYVHLYQSMEVYCNVRTMSYWRQDSHE